MGAFEDNINAMKSGFPELYERFCGIDPSSLEPASLVCHVTQEEAAEWVDRQEKTKSENVFIFGLGDGKMVSRIFGLCNENAHFLIYEPSLMNFIVSLGEFDLAFCFQKGVRMVVDGLNEDLFMAIMEEMLTFENYQDYFIYMLPGMSEAFPESRERFVRHIAADGIGWMSDIRNTVRREIHLSPYNQLFNLKYLEQGTIVPRLSKTIPKDVPVLLVGAGPSLAEDIEVIRRYRDRVYIFAADDICSYLLENDIYPDAFICVEADKAISWFRDERMRDVPMFAKVNTSCKIMEWHRGYKIFGYDDGFVSAYYDRFHVPKSQYRYGGNTMTAFFSVCDEMGMETVILVGQDMCYGTDGQTHVDVNEGDSVSESGDFFCENNQGEQVKTRYDWFTFLRWYESAIYDCGMKQVINAAINGAKVKGTKVMHLEEAIQRYGKEREVLSSVLERTATTYGKGETPDLVKLFEELRTEVDCVERIIEENPKSPKRKEYMVYGLLQLYETADERDDFVISQREGLCKIRSYIENFLEKE